MTKRIVDNTNAAPLHASDFKSENKRRKKRATPFH